MKHAEQQTPAKPRSRRSRTETEQRLIDVALELIREKGILSGLNLREVAEGAGVNRGNIYHYFGSRQELLRAAINRGFKTIVDRIKPSAQTKHFVQRRSAMLGLTEHSNDSLLRALLIMDGDEAVDPIPQHEEALSRLRQDVIDGDIDREHDLEALQVALSALVRGYSIFRQPYAHRLDLDASELDRRVQKIVRGWLTAMAPSTPSD